MSATADQSAALGNDSQFQQRVKALFIVYAGVVYGEDPATPNHTTRLAFARQVIAGNANFSNMAMTLANRTNLVGSNVTYNFSSKDIVTDATDAAISSQIATDWNMFAGV